MASAVFERYLAHHARELMSTIWKEKEETWVVRRNGSVDNKEVVMTKSEPEPEEVLLFTWASTQLLQKTFFDLASSTEHNLVQDNRKHLYALHAAFQALTGVPLSMGRAI